MIWFVFALIIFGFLALIGRETMRDSAPEHIPWGEGKDLSALLPIPGMDEIYKGTAMYELEKWWDKEHLDVREFWKKYPEEKPQTRKDTFEESYRINPATQARIRGLKREAYPEYFGDSYDVFERDYLRKYGPLREEKKYGKLMPDGIPAEWEV
jgi:hypothetical protein